MGPDGPVLHKPRPDHDDLHTINILDFDAFIAELAHGTSYGSQGDTTCGMSGTHADFNADGVVDVLDYSFIVDNFLASSEGLCCPGPLGTLGAEFNPVTALSIRELRKAGRADLIVADLNHDGMLDLEDMNAFADGIMPPIVPSPARHAKGR